MTREEIIQPLLHSPLLPEIVEVLQQYLREETDRRKKFYAEMNESQKIEFIEGQVVLHSPAKLRHLEVVKRILFTLESFVARRGLGGAVLSEKCLCVFPRNDFEPDVVYFSPQKMSDWRADTMFFPVPDLVVEVLSESTEARDRGVKFVDYEAHGVQEYWIVDPDLQIVEQYVFHETGYVLRMKSGSGDLGGVVIPGLLLPVRSFFDPEIHRKLHFP